MTRSGRHVFASAQSDQGWQATQLLVAGRDCPNAGRAATADPLLSGRAERFGAGTLAEDDRGFQSTGRKQAAEAIPLRGATTGKRSRCGAGAVEQSAAGKDTAVGTVLPASVEISYSSLLFIGAVSGTLYLANNRFSASARRSCILPPRFAWTRRNDAFTSGGKYALILILPSLLALASAGDRSTGVASDRAF